MPLFVEEIRTQGARDAIRRFVHVLYVLMPGLILGYLIMGLIWPWSIMQPGNPFTALTYFSHFFEKPWKEMFDGALVSVPDMPWSYLPTLFALQMPEVLLVLSIAGVAGTLAALTRRDVPARRKTIFLMLTLAATLPLLIAMVKRPALYNGIRHFVFVIPPMTVIAGVAFAWTMNWLRENRVQLATRGARHFRLRPVVAARRDDPAASLSIHPLQPHRRHRARRRRPLHAGLLGPRLQTGFRRACANSLTEKHEVPPKGRKWKVAVCGPQRPAQVALGPDFTIDWRSHAADFAMTLGEFYCKGLTAPVMVEIKRDDVVYARVYDIRGRSISSLLSIPPP